MAQQDKEISTERNALSYGVAVRSLKRDKKTPQYRARVARKLAEVKLALAAATTDEARREAKCNVDLYAAELASLEAGNEPDVYSGLVHFERPTPE